MDIPLELTPSQFDLVYNSFSFVIAAMGAAFLFFLLQRSRLPEKNRMALTLSTLVVGIALYHYLRIFDSWSSAFTLVDGTYVETGTPFNEGYRYVDWLITVPLLLAELVVVLKLTQSKTRSLLIRLTVAAVAMIALGYPGELAEPDSATRTIFGILSTIPFLYILWVLFAELNRSLVRQSPKVQGLVSSLRWIILITWGVYPMAYIAPSWFSDPGTAEVVRQVGYSAADVLAKPVFGLVVLAIALAKAREDREGADPLPVDAESNGSSVSDGELQPS